MKVGDILRAASDADFWRRVAPSLRIGAPRTAPWPAPPSARLREGGWTKLERVVPAELTARAAAGLHELQNASIPTPALYVFDEAWEIAAGLAPIFAELVGAPARLLPDVWAWLVPSVAGASGWSPHRGVAERGTKVVNVWIALSDVGEESACMHVVPFDRDPFYPNALDRIDVDPSRALALPVPAGSVLAWNASVLHWGGAMTPGAPARLSMSFSIAPEGPLAPGAPPTFSGRVDLVADMLVAYAPVAGVSGPWLEWARLWSGMRAARARR